MVKTIFKIAGLTMAGLMTWFSPMQLTHGADGCCATCQLKKEDETKIEYLEEENTEG
jgi:hypothetical protein